jgi:molybdopterin molybdotransferase
MISYAQALQVLEEVGRSRKPRVETLSLSQAIGKILAHSVSSPEDVPSFTNSAMDGFALRASDTHGATQSDPIRIPVHGLVAAGDLRAFEDANRNKPGTAVEIMTGAPLPINAYDAVIRVEDVVVNRAPSGQVETILISKPVKIAENVRPLGTDFSKGQLVLRKNVRIAPEHILALTSLGITNLPVKHMPRIVILSTGSELVPPEEPQLQPGMIRNSTGPFLKAALLRLGLEADYLGIVRDDPKLYRKRIEGALSDGADLIISTGAVSMGKYDFVSEVLDEMGAKTYFHKVAIRPGKPVLFAEFNTPNQTKCAFFGVPGNPVSTAVGLRFFIEPFIRAILSLEREQPAPATLSRDCVKPEGLRCFFKGRARFEKNGISVEALKGQASYMVSSLLDANCWVIFPEEGSCAKANGPVEIVPLHNGFGREVFL